MDRVGKGKGSTICSILLSLMLETEPALMGFIVYGYLSKEWVLCEWLELMNFPGKIVVIRRRIDEIIKETVKESW